MGTLRRGLSRLRSPFKKRQSGINHHLQSPEEAEPVAVGGMYGSAITFGGSTQTIKAPPVPARSSTMGHNTINSALSAAAMRAKLRVKGKHNHSMSAGTRGELATLGQGGGGVKPVLSDGWLGSGDKRASMASINSTGSLRRNSMLFDEMEEDAADTTYEQFVLQPGYRPEPAPTPSGGGGGGGGDSGGGNSGSKIGATNLDVGSTPPTAAAADVGVGVGVGTAPLNPLLRAAVPTSSDSRELPVPTAPGMNILRANTGRVVSLAGKSEENTQECWMLYSPPTTIDPLMRPLLAA